MNYLQNAITFEEKEESKFSRDQFKSCFAELSKLIQEVTELKAKNTEDVRISLNKLCFLIKIDLSQPLGKEEDHRKAHSGLINHREVEEAESVG